MYVKTFDTPCGSGLHNLKYHVLDHLVKDILIFETVHVLDRSPYKYYHIHVRDAHTITF